MRIHVHNVVGGHIDPVMTSDWPESALQEHVVTFGSDVEDFRRAAPEIEVLLVASLALRELLPLDAPRLRIISCMSAGLDMLAPYEWLPAGVSLLNNSGVHAAKAAEYALMALLMLANGVPAIMASQSRRTWEGVRVGQIDGKRLTIVGLGAIGQACARAAKRNGMIVTGIRRSAGAHPACEAVLSVTDLAQVLPATDYLLMTLPLTPDTRGLLDGPMLANLPAHAGIINIGRGGTIDEMALCALLDAGRLGGAVLDVFQTEPLQQSSRLWETHNLIVTPHMSSDDPASHNRRTVEILLDNLAAYATGSSLPNAFDVVAGTRIAAQ